GVDSTHFVQLLHAVERALEILSHLARIARLVVERQLSQLGERLPKVAVVHQFASLLPLRPRRHGPSRRLRLSEHPRPRRQNPQDRLQLQAVRHGLPPDSCTAPDSAAWCNQANSLEPVAPVLRPRRRRGLQKSTHRLFEPPRTPRTPTRRRKPGNRQSTLT